jgi:hypothetical protein
MRGALPLGRSFLPSARNKNVRAGGAEHVLLVMQESVEVSLVSLSRPPPSAAACDPRAAPDGGRGRAARSRLNRDRLENRKTDLSQPATVSAATTRLIRGIGGG